MQDAVMAVLHHSVKSQNPEKHKLCPEGGNSWCAHKRTGQWDPEMDNKPYHQPLLALTCVD